MSLSMEVNMQTDVDTSDKSKDEVPDKNECVSKKLKLSEPVDKALQLDTDTSKNDSNDVEMTLPRENSPKPCSSKQKMPETTSEQEHFQKDNDSDEYDNDSTTEYKPKEGFNYPLEMDASDMLDEIDSIVDGRYPTVTERYFTPYYQLDVTQPGDDVCILIHTNRICMFTLAPSHIIFQKNKKIVKCDYQVSEKLNRLKNKVSGKAKHGAQPLQNNSNLCRLTCDDSSVYVVKCCIIGKLLEVNERLVHEPELLKRLPHHGGYIAIALPNLKHLDKIKNKLLDQKRYEAALKERKERVEKEKSEKLDDTLVVEGKEEMKNKDDSHAESVENKEQKEIVNVNESEAKVDAMEIVKS